jgi:hypothetical protein
MKKIESLTEEQKAKFKDYVKKWIDIGIQTDRFDQAKAEKIVNNFRECAKLGTGVPTIVVDNPLEAWVCCALLVQKVPVQDLKAEMELVFTAGNPKKWTIPKASLPYQTGSFFSASFAFYDYMIEELKVPLEKDIWIKYKQWEATSQLGCIYPFPEATIVSQKPTTVKLNENNVLHSDGSPALEYAGHGDIRIYCLNGVRVPQYLAETPAEQIDISLYNQEKNADVKAEFLRKVGVERFIAAGEVKDSYEKYPKTKEYSWWHKSQYQLIDMASIFVNIPYVPYLKMLNQTTGIWHMEAVSPACKTISAALKERFGGRDFTIEAIS